MTLQPLICFGVKDFLEECQKVIIIDDALFIFEEEIKIWHLWCVSYTIGDIWRLLTLITCSFQLSCKEPERVICQCINIFRIRESITHPLNICVSMLLWFLQYTIIRISILPDSSIGAICC